jgi:phospholipase C
MNRRRFTQTLLTTGLGVVGATTGCVARLPPHPAPPPGPLPNPTNVSPSNSGIEHVIVVVMENRSFDHFLGWLPRADGIPAGLRYIDTSGASHAVYSLANDYTGCGHNVPNNSYGAPNLTAYDQGHMDGFLRVPGNTSTASVTTARRSFRFSPRSPRRTRLVITGLPRSWPRLSQIACFCGRHKPIDYPTRSP